VANLTSICNIAFAAAHVRTHIAEVAFAIGNGARYSRTKLERTDPDDDPYLSA
jgi:hypothetical protein